MIAQAFKFTDLRCDLHSRARAVSSLVLVAALPVMATPSAQAAEISVTNDLAHRYGEVQMAVNPKNPNNIVYADVQLGFTYACQKEKTPDCEIKQSHWSGPIPMSQPQGFFTNNGFDVVGLFTSLDGGKTWQRTTVPLPPKEYPKLMGWGDPSVAVTADGTFYLSFDNMDWGSPDNALVAGGIGVSKSTDGGKTWSKPVLTGTPMDGPKIVADTSTGTIYAASSSVLGPLSTGNPETPRGTISTRWLASSKDGVRWSQPQPIGGQASTSAARGVFAAAFKTAGQKSPFGDANNELCGSEPAPCVVFETTKDSGATWDRHVVPGLADAGARPVLAADPSKAAHFALAVQTNDDKEFAVYETRDSGKTWSKPATFTDDATKKHYHVWMTYSPEGVLGLVWRTSQPAPGASAAPAPTAGAPAAAFLMSQNPQPYNVWAIISRDGGGTFSEPLKVSGADSPAPQSGMLGNAGDDYSSIVIFRDTAYLGWADWRPGERQGYFRAIKLSEFKQRQ
jgi:hypothetical protein